ncbi:hypothetical protein HMPREF1624_00038 [Sporothrix schenckii ATCC 58251]|uniref:Uncharacterized protein n=1 Tax=Sporothrix schenckii (strain ATCC 58251 / de Perez 2211183) TaxID=1391915 RepID=U7Q1G2_SPOS1|nr:hypothetical protein HMPREF1624_00038 [Sporothrix schenckii ATCC 58251]
MNLFRKRDKQKIAPVADDRVRDNGQNYLGHGSSNGPSFTISEADLPAKGGSGSNTSRSRNFKALKAFGGGGNGSGNGNGRRGATNPTPVAAVSATALSARLLQTFPEDVLARIFAFVCPHSQDRTYEKCEDSTFGDCILCDTRDLAHCVHVCRRWRPVAEQVLYTSIRIDTVHYCAREAILAEKRKRRSFFDRNAEPEDTPDARLKLLCRTLRDGPTHRLAPYVQFLKLPYMLRESRHPDIARTVSVLQNLRYVDLPEGLFMDEPAYLTLKLEIEAKCPGLRKMTYMGGAERSLEALASGNRWCNLEVLELIKVAVDPAMLRHVLCLLTELRALKVTEPSAGPHSFSDDVLVSAPADGVAGGPLHDFYTASLPLLEELVLTNTQMLTSEGLHAYLSRPESGRALKVLTLNSTGVKPWSLRGFLDRTPNLRHLTVADEVTVALPIAANTKDIQPLASTSLRTLNYEIAPAKGVSPYAGVTRSYYNYLSGSILSGGLPNLRAVHVRDAQFPESLLGDLPLPGPIGGAAFGDFGGGGSNNRRPASASATASSASGTASALNSPLSTGSLGQLHSPVGFLSPQSPNFPQSAVPRTLPANAGVSSISNGMKPPSTNPFLDPLSASPPKPWVAGHNPRFSSNNPFAGMISPQKVHTLEVFTKGDDDNDWSSIIVGDGAFPFFGAGMNLGGGNGSSSRPVSSYGLGADLGAVGGRKSILINMGPGNFLAVPDAEVGGGGGRGGGGGGGGGGGSGFGTNLASSPKQSPDLWPRPVTAGESRSEKRDLWR